MDFGPRDFLLLLLCVSAVVNVLFYALSEQTVLRQDPGDFVDLRQDDEFIDGVHRDKATVRNQVPGTTRSKKSSEGITPRKSSRRLHNANNPGQVFSFPVNNHRACARNASSETWDLVIVVFSAVENFLRRNAIRNTWGSVLYEQNATLVFLVGKGQHPSLGPQVIKEAELYQDIVQVDFDDAYDNLTLKSIAMLQWLNDYCSNSRFFLKADDDIFVNVPNVIKELNLCSEERFFMCHVFQNAEPIRHKFSKWYISNQEFSGRNFPTYCSGTAYAFPFKIISALYTTATDIPFFRMEDIFLTGIAAMKLDIRHIHNDGFSAFKREATGCAYEKALTGHSVTTKQMFIIYAQLQSREIDCDTMENKFLKRVESEY